MITKRADEIRPGDMFRGRIVEAVSPRDWMVVVYYRNGQTFLRNETLVLVEGSVATPPPPDGASPAAK